MRHIRALMLGITLLSLMAACCGYVVLREFDASAGTSDEPVEIEIGPGESTSEIATKLHTAELIRQPVFFTAMVRLQGLDGKLQAGRYLLRPSMSMNEIIVALQYNRVDEVQVTIPEGLRLEEIAERIGNTGIVQTADFLASARQSAAFKPDHFLLTSLPNDASLEGYLFPDTYRIAATATVTEIITLMLKNFDTKYTTFESEVYVPNVSVHDIVTMASIVQRESALVEEMPRIAAVFWNRLDPKNIAETGGGRLQADATIQYTLGYSAEEQTWWRKRLSPEDLAIDNPYNTRQSIGLPPGPISNPGLDALRSAAQPDQSGNYLYFVVSCALDGSHKFATTLEEFRTYEAEFLTCSGS